MLLQGRRLLRKTARISLPMLAFAAMVVPVARAGITTHNAIVKPTSTASFTSFTYVAGNIQSVVTPPAGWVTTHQGGSRVWYFTGGSIAPGGTFTVTESRPGAALSNGMFTEGDYPDGRGVPKCVTVCNDPLSITVVQGGATGTSYLGYAIPANQYGYFYEMWNPAGFTDMTKTLTLNIGTASGATNFAVLPNSFSVDELSQLVVPSTLPPGADYYFTNYMDAQDATGTPGVSTSWSFDPTTGNATMTFDPSDPTQGLGANLAGDVVAYTSPNAPYTPDTTNTSSTFVSNYSCPNDTALVPLPTVPEPTSGLLIGIAGLTILAWKGIRGMSVRRAEKTAHGARSVGTADLS